MGHCCRRCCLYTAILAKGLNIEASYLEQICTHKPQYVQVNYELAVIYIFQMSVILLFSFGADVLSMPWYGH